MALNYRAIEHHRPHSHQTGIGNFTGMDDGAMANGHVLANHRGKPAPARMRAIMADMDDRAILHIAARADADEIDITAHHRKRPDGHILPQHHIANYLRRRIHIHPRTQNRPPAKIVTNRFHAASVAPPARQMAAPRARRYTMEMKIASWNVNSLNIRLPQLLAWLQTAAPDVLGVQETKLEDHKFPREAIEAAGYHVAFHGQKTYNGVALLSRAAPLQDIQRGIPGFDDPQARAIAATVNGIRIVNLYVVNGQEVGSDKYAYKLRWLAAVHDWLAAELQRWPQMVLLGDFNIAPDDRDVHDPATWNTGHILTSQAERDALQRLAALGLHDALRLHSQAPGQFTWWDYRQGAFRRNLGLRIDLTLVSGALKEHCLDAGIDREPRTWERPSDHAPAWVQLAPVTG